MRTNKKISANVKHIAITPSPILEVERTVNFSFGFSLSIPHAPGIYVIHDIRGILYIGQSENLRRRYDEHLWKERNPLLTEACAAPVGVLQFSWFQAPVDTLSKEERRLINVFRPICNRIQYKS